MSEQYTLPTLVVHSLSHVWFPWPHGLQHTRLLCPSLSPRVCSNSRPLSQWCHLTILSPTATFFYPQSFLASVSFPMSRLFISGSQRIGASASASVIIMNIQGSFPSGWTGLTFLLSKGLLKSLIQHHNLKASILYCPAIFMDQLSHPYMTTGKTTDITRKVMSLLFNMLSRFLTVFLPRSKCLLILWPQSPSTVILEPEKIKSTTVFTFSPSICHEVMGPDAMILAFWMLSCKSFSFSSFTLIKRLFSASSLSAIKVWHLHIWGCDFSRQFWFQLVIHSAWHFAWCTLHRR